MVVFDLTEQPELLRPSYGIYALFILVGVGLLTVAVLMLRARSRGRKQMLAFSILWLSVSPFMMSQEINDVRQIRALVERRAYHTIEGCLDFFIPGLPYGTKSVVDHERWSVDGVEFDYGAGQVRRGYQIVEPRGGFVHRDTRVRVSYVESDYYGRREIVRLAVAQGLCSPAPIETSRSGTR